MIEFIQKSGKSDLVLFIHGFTGGRDTWRHEVDGYFYDHLLEYSAFREGYDIAVFEYYSKLLNLFPIAGSITKRIYSLFKSIQPKVQKNISIYEISNLLASRIRFDLEGYQNIVVIAHSMGGLVTKSYALQELEAGRHCKIKLILSLAVPHLGADLATYGKLLSNNQQIEDLAPLSELCPKLNDAWVKRTDKPIIKYFYGAYDTVVTKQSAIGTDNLEQDVISCDDTHLTICKPPRNGLLVTAAIQFLKEFKSHTTPIALQRISDPEQYEDEIFVLKLLLADVHDASVRNSKEFFLNAEYARKLLSSDADQQKLHDLYNRIRTIYLNSYEQHVAKNEARNSSTLVSTVHARIIQEDAGFLKAAHPMLQALHKQGMLHQLANDLGNDIWWSEERSRDALKNAREKFSSTSKGEAP
jgi:protein SERAC1